MDRHEGRAMTRLSGDVMRGTDAWSRAARRAREQATRLGLALDEEDLALQDVHDLQALCTALRGGRAAPTGPRWTALLRLRGRALGAAAPLARRA